VTLQEEVVNYTFETVDGILFLGEWLLPDGSMLVTEKVNLYHLKNGSKPK
jgi:hypothetical protein